MLPPEISLNCEVKIAFIIARTRNNLAVLFGTLKVQRFWLLSTILHTWLMQLLQF